MLSSRTRAASRRASNVRGFQTLVESLERRAMLHAAIYHALPANLSESLANGEHITATQLRSVMPGLEGKDLWDASTFNPTNSSNPDEWLYDPHFIEDDRSVAEQVGFNPDVTVAANPEADALPDMVPLRNWASGSFSPFIDTTEQPGRVLYKFANAIGNQGAGPASLFSQETGTPPAGSGISSWVNPDGTQNVLQRIYSYNSATNSFSFSRYSPGGTFIFHPGHGHFHLEGYAEYKLLHSVNGQPGGQVFRNDGTEAVGEKVGFCLINVSTWSLPGGQSSTSLPGSNGSGQPNPGCGFQQGVSVGRADVYGSGYDGQWIDVTGVPNGNYFIAVTADSKNAIVESDETNNTMYVAVTLNVNPPAGGIALDRFDQASGGGPNNTFATATDLGERGVAVEAGLTAHAGVDFDYFKFTATSSGTYNTQLAFTDGNMDLYVYDANQNLLGQGTTPADSGGQQLTETVSATFTAGQTYYVMARGALISGASYEGTSNNYSLRTFVLPTIAPSTPDASAGETGSNAGSVHITRNGPDVSPLTVLLNIGGSATRGVDYNIYQDDVLIPVGTNQVVISTDNMVARLDIVPIGDAIIETQETVTVTAVNSTAYVLGAGGTQTVTIKDTPPQVTGDAFAYETLPQQLSFDFTLDVSASLSPGDVLLFNPDMREPIIPNSVSYNAALNRATFSVNSPLPDGNYVAVIEAGNVTHALGEPLAQNVEVPFFVFAGDANHDRTVNINDFAALAANFNQPGTFSQGNFNYDAAVDISDFALLASRFNTSLPAARRAPVATGTSVLAQAALPPRSPFAGSRIDSVAEELELSGSPDVI